MKNRNAYIVKDSKTYLYAEEAKFKLADEDDLNILFVVIPRVTNSRLKERMEELISPEEWDKVCWILTHSNGTDFLEMKHRKMNELTRNFKKVREYFYHFIDNVRMKRRARKYRPCKFAVSTHKNTHENLAALLQPEELVLVDSGHRVFSRISKKSGFIDYSERVMRRSRLDRILFRLSGFKVYNRKKTSLFTIYGDEIETRHRIIRNEFDRQQHKLKSKKTNDLVFWISTPIYQMASGVEIGDYIEYIRASVELKQIGPGQLVYVPHPGKQTDEEIQLISERLSCKVDQRDIPVEMKVASYEDLPRMCISPFSSALVNIYKATEGKIPQVSAWHPEFNYFKIWLDWRKSVEENSGLNIEFMEVESSVPLFHIKPGERRQGPLYETFKDWERQRQ
ncbi:MAG TPA: hypothetical protein VK040_08455 [Balneolaceae bacterium]|nr:hypothetical protein [Balneolaceae bacterium]